MGRHSAPDHFHDYIRPLDVAPDAEQRSASALPASGGADPEGCDRRAGNHELPHVSNRMESWNMNVRYEGADYLLYAPAPLPDQEATIGVAARAAGWKVVAEHPRFVLLKKPD